MRRHLIGVVLMGAAPLSVRVIRVNMLRLIHRTEIGAFCANFDMPDAR